MTVVGMPGRGLGGARRIFVRLRTVPAVRPWAARKAHEQHQVRHKASSRLQAHHRATTLHGKLVNPACQPESPALWRYPAAPVVPEVLGSCHRPDRRRGRKECLGIGNARGPILWEHQFQGGVEASAAPVRTLLTYIEHARAKNRTEGVVYRHWYHVQGMWQDRVHVNLSLASCADFHVVHCQLMIRQVELGKSRTLIEMQRMLSRCIAARLLHRKNLPGCGSLYPTGVCTRSGDTIRQPLTSFLQWRKPPESAPRIPIQDVCHLPFSILGKPPGYASQSWRQACPQG